MSGRLGEDAEHSLAAGSQGSVQHSVEGTVQPALRDARPHPRWLRLEDISDQRAYEREREGFRRQIIELKRIRRVSVGPIVSFVFENEHTVRFQVQEMARAERMVSDQQILAELAAYNPLIPDPGELSATLLIELTSQEDLKRWLPALVGIERAAYLVVGDARVNCSVDPAHAEQLTRAEVTASVHYVRFRLDDDQVAAFQSAPVSLGIALDSYSHETRLSEATRAELLSDLLPLKRT